MISRTLLSTIIATIFAGTTFPVSAHIAGHHENGIPGLYHSATHIDHPGYWMILVLVIVLALLFSLFIESTRH